MYWRYPATSEGIPVKRVPGSKSGFVRVKGKLFPLVHLDDATGGSVYRENAFPCDACGEKFKSGEHLYEVQGLGHAGAIHRRCAEVVAEEAPPAAAAVVAKPPTHEAE
jgi:hypothetical protein